MGRGWGTMQHIMHALHACTQGICTQSIRTNAPRAPVAKSTTHTAAGGTMEPGRSIRTACTQHAHSMHSTRTEACLPSRRCVALVCLHVRLQVPMQQRVFDA